ncbi:MAG TPA: DMT family transporter [Chitinophagaceae bacterium]|nr:DMT family transporter [Chitinophagaceae bacterium]
MRKAFLQLHAAVILAGFTGILGKIITLNEGLLVWYRLLITVITLWVWFYFAGKIKRVSPGEVLKIFGAGLVAALHWVTFYGSIKYANVSVALVCFSAIGFFTAILEPLILRKKFSWQEILLGLMVMAGIYIIFHFDPEYKVGIIIGIISALLGCLFPIFNRKFLETHASETVTLYELTGGLLTLSLLMPFYLRAFPADHVVPNTQDLVGLLVLAWFCTVLAFQLSMNALKKISAFTVNLTYNLEPLYGILLAFLVYQENQSLDWSFYVGLSVIVLSVFLQSLRIYRQAKAR